MRPADISIRAAFASAALTASVLFGQQPQPDAPSVAGAPYGVASSLSPDTAVGPVYEPLEPAPAEPNDDAPVDKQPQAPKPPSPGVGGMGMGMGMGMGPGGGAGPGGPGYGVTWYPTRSITGGATDESLGLVRQRLALAAPVWRDGSDSMLLTANVQNSLFSTDAVLPTSGRAFPTELWNVSLGAMYRHAFDNGWSGMLGVNFGSASDKPFHSSDEINLGFMSFLEMPARNQRDMWRFSLMYSPVGNLTFPIPGVAYQWNPSDTLRVSLGVPFALMWRPTEDLTIDVSYMPLLTVNARATYRLSEKLFVYGGFESAQEAYMLADRENSRDRFMGFEKRLLGGLRYDVLPHAALDFNAGYAFDRYYGIGQNQIDDLRDQLDIAPGAFLSANFRLRF